MKNFKIFMLIAVLLVNTASLNAAGFSEKTVSAANYVITTGGGSGGYQLDDSSTHTSGNGYDVSDSDNYLRSYDKGTIDIAMTPKEVGLYTFETTIHAPGKTEPAVDGYGDYKYLMTTGADDAPGVSSIYSLEVNSALVDSNMRFKLDDFELYNVQNNEIIEFTTVIISPSGVETIITTDDSVEADYNIDYDLTASASSSTYLDISLSGNKNTVANPTGDASLGANGIMLTASTTAGVKGPSGTIVGSQELDPASGFSQDFALSIVNNDSGVCGVDASTLDYYLVDEALSGLDWIYHTYQEAQTGFAATGSSNFSGSITSQYTTGIQTPARNGSGDSALNQTIDASALQGSATNLLEPWDPSQPIHINLSEFSNSQDIEHDNKLFANTNVKIWIPLFDVIDDLGGCDAYSFTIKADAVPGTAVGTAIDGSSITEGASISDSIVIKDNTVTVKPSPEPIKTNMVTDLLMHDWTWGGYVTASDIDNNLDMGPNAKITGAASYRGNNYSQYNGVSYRDYKQQLSMKTHYWIGESEHGYELIQKWDPTDFEYINEPTHVTYREYDLDVDSPEGYKPRVRMDQADYTTMYGYLPAGETNWKSVEQMYYDNGKEGSSYLEWSDVYDESRTVAGIKVVYDKEIVIEDYVDEDGVVQKPAILVDMYTALRTIDANGDMDPTQVSASQTINSELLDGATYPNEASNPLYQKTKYKSNNFDVDTRHSPSDQGGMTFNTFYSTTNNKLIDNNGLSDGSAGNESGLEYNYMPGQQEDLELELIGNPIIYKQQLVSDDDIDVHDADFRYYLKLPKSANVNNDYELIEMLVSDAGSLTAQSCQLPKLDGETTSCSYNAGNILKADIRDFEIERVYTTTTNQYIIHFYDYDVPSIDNFNDILPTFKLKIRIPYSEVVAGKTIKISSDSHAESDSHGVSFGFRDSWHLIEKEYILSTILADKVIEEAPTEKKIDAPINYTTHFQRVTNPEGAGSDKKGFILLPTNGDESGSSFNGDYTISNLQIDGIDYESAVVGTDYSELMCSEQPINDESMISYDTTNTSLWTSCDTTVNPTMIYINYGPSSDNYNYINFQINPTGNQPGDVYMSKSIYPDFGIDADSNIVETVIYDEVSIQLKKVDEVGNPVEGVSFEIYNPEGELIQTITTNSEGFASSATIFVSTAIAPDYTVVEKSAPVEYEVDPEPYTVQLNNKINYVDGDRDSMLDSDSDGDELNDPIVNIRKSGQIELNKVDQNMDPVEGVVFEVYNAPYSSSAPVVTTLTTDSSGYALSSELVAGDYVIKEVSAPDGYVFDPAITYEVSLTENGVTVPIDGDSNLDTDADGDGDKTNDPIVNKLLVDNLLIDKTSTTHPEGTTVDMSDTSVSTNSMITYAVTLDNSGTNYDRTDVTITDLLDDPYLDKATVSNVVLRNLTTDEFLYPTIDYTVDAGANTITLNTLAAETVYEITFNVMTTPTFDDPGVTKLIDTSVDNTVTVTVDGSEQTADYHIPIIPGIDTVINKELIGETNVNGQAGNDEVLTYMVTVTNGDTEQTDVVITDTPDSDDLSNIQLVTIESDLSGELTADDYSTAGNVLTIENLAPNEKIKITYTLDVASSFADATDITNDVCLSSAELAALGSADLCSGVTTPKEIEGLVIDKTSTTHPEGVTVDNSDIQAVPSELVTYVVTLDNTTTTYDRSNVTITDLLDDQYLNEASASNLSITDMTTGTELVAGTDYSFDNATNTITLNTLAAKTEYQISFDVMTTPVFDDSLFTRLIDQKIDNTVTVTVDGEEQTADYHIPIDLTANSNLTITKQFVADTNDNGFAGNDEILTYMVTVTNGEIEQTNVVITDTPDSDDLSNIQLVTIESELSGELPADDYSTAGNVLTLASLAPNDTIKITYTLDVASSFADETDITNGVCLSTDELTATDSADLCSEVTTPKEIEGLVIDKTSTTHPEGSTVDNSDTQVAPSELVTYVVTLDNTTTTYDRNDVTITDLLADDYLDEATASNLVVMNATTGTELVAGTDYSFNNATNTITLNTLEAKTEYQISFDVMTTAVFNDSTKLIDTNVDNTVTVTVDGSEQTADYHIPIDLTANSNLTINKQFVADTNDNGFAGNDEVLTYMVTVTNGEIEQTNVVITDTPDSDDLSNIQLVTIESELSGELPADDYSTAGNVLTLASLAPNETIKITYTLDVASSFADATDITNGVCLSTDELTATDSADLCSEVTTSKEIEGLVIDKTSTTHPEGATVDNSDTQVAPSELVTYVVTLDNTTTTYDRNDVTITDLLADDYLDEATASNLIVMNATTGTELVAGTDYSFDTATNTITLNTLAAKTEYQISFDVMTTAVFNDSTKLIDTNVDNTVTVTVDGSEQTADYHIPIDLTANSNLTINKQFVADTNDNGFAGNDEVLTYMVTVTNGEVEQTNVVITDTPDSDDLSNIQLVTITSDLSGELTADDYSTAGNVLTLASLAPNDTIEITYTLDVASSFADETDITNGVCLSTDELTATDSADLCSEVTTPKEIAELAIDKTSTTHPEGSTVDNSDTQVAPSELVTYVVTLDNTTTTYNRSDVTITDLLADEYLDEATASNLVVMNTTSGTKLVAGTDYSFDNATNTITLNTLEAKTEYQISFDVMTTAVFNDSTKLIDTNVDNTVTVTVEGSEQTADYHIPIDLTANSNLTINKQFVADTNDNGFAGNDEVLTYMVTVTNGEVEQTNVVITDTPDSDDLSNIQLVTIESDLSGELPADDYSTAGNVLTLASLAPNETIEITYTLDVASSFADETDITNGVCLSTDELTATDSDDLCSEVTTPKEIAELAIDKTSSTHPEGSTVDNSDTQVAPSELVTYVVTLDNTTTTYNRSDVTITDLLADEYLDATTASNLVVMNTTTGTKLIAGTDYSFDNATNTITLNTLAAKTEYQISFDVMTTAVFDDSLADDTSVDNTVTVTVDGSEQTADYHIPVISEQIEGTTTIKKIVKDTSGDSKVQAGEELTYTLELSNNTGNDAHNVVVRDSMLESMPSWLSFNGEVTMEPSNVAYSGSFETSDLTFDIVEAGSTIKVSYSVTASKPLPSDVTELKNIATDNGANPDECTINSSDCSETVTPLDPDSPIIDPAEGDTIISKAVVDEDGDGVVRAGEQLSYTIMVTNSGVNDAHNVVVRDSMLEDVPTWMTFNNDVTISPDDIGYSGDLTTGDLTFNEIEANQTVKINYSLTAAQPIPENIVEVVNIVTDNGENPDLIDPDTCVDSQDCASVTTPTYHDDPIIDPVEGKTAIKKEVSDSDGDGIISGGEVITYVVTVNNAGSSDAHNVVVRDSMLENTPIWLTFNNDVTVNPTSIDYSGNLTEKGLSFNTIEAGEEVTITYSLTANDVIPEDVEALNVATNNGVDPSTLDPDSCEQVDTCSSTLTETAYIVTETGSETDDSNLDDEEMSITDEILAVTGSRGAMILVDLFMILIIGFTLKKRITKY